MKKVIITVLFAGLIIFSFFYFRNKTKSNNIVKATVESVCYVQTNRLSPAQMIEDNLSKEEKINSITLINKKYNEIAIKYGYKSWSDMMTIFSESFSEKKQKNIEKEITKEIRSTCAYGIPDFNF